MGGWLGKGACNEGDHSEIESVIISSIIRYLASYRCHHEVPDPYLQKNRNGIVWRRESFGEIIFTCN